MRDFEERLRLAQGTLDRSGGDLSVAVTKAAFRLHLVAAIAEVWPHLVKSYGEDASRRIEGQH